MTALSAQVARRRITFALFAGRGAFSAANIAGFTIMSIVAAQLGGTPLLAGLPGAGFLFGRALGGYSFGRLMDAIGRRHGLSLGYLLGVAGSGLAAFGVTTASFGVFLTATLILGVARGSADQARFAAAEAYGPDERGRIIGLIVFAGTVGAIGGPLLVGAATDLAGDSGLDPLAGPWIAGAGLAAIALVLTFGFVRPEPRTVAPEPAANPDGSRRGSAAATTARPLREIFDGSGVRLAVASMVVGQAVMTMVMTIIPLHMHHIHYHPGSISVAMAVHTLGMFGLSAFTGRFVDRFGPIPIITLGGLQLVIAGVLALFARAWSSSCR